VAVLAAFMSIQEGMKGWQKAVWMLLMGAPLIVEVRSIRVDQAEANAQAIKDRANQEEKLQTTSSARRSRVYRNPWWL
jgi:hypothetical protein